ncbi:MAG: hypothetical protein NE334_13420 [Lentisphaeraceae bacterium]|nr:hypothetical protein [Lentisphaeraceae bacterium]
MAQPTTNQEWLDHWKKKLHEVSETGQKYSIQGAQTVETLKPEYIQQQIDLYEDKVLEETYSYNGKVEVR